MPLTPEEKAENKRQRMLNTAQKYTPNSYCRKYVAPEFQRMTRAEVASLTISILPAVVDGDIRNVPRSQGQCVCVTCGKAQAWNSGIKGMHTGHFLASRRNSILFEEDNVAPQCSYCNFYRSGAPQEFRLWMLEIRGPEVVEKLERLKTESVSFSREELVDRLIEYKARLKAAEERMEG